MEDQISNVQEMSKLILEVASGNVSSHEGVKRLKILNKINHTILDRSLTVKESKISEEFDFSDDTHIKRIQTEWEKTNMDCVIAIQKLWKSGKMTKEFSDELKNF